MVGRGVVERGVGEGGMGGGGMVGSEVGREKLCVTEDWGLQATASTTVCNVEGCFDQR